MGTAARLRKAPSPYSERNTLLPRRAVTSSQNRAYRPAVSVRPTPSWKSQSTRPLGSALPLHAEGMELSRLFRYRPMYMLGRACGDASPFGERR